MNLTTNLSRPLQSRSSCLVACIAAVFVLAAAPAMARVEVASDTAQSAVLDQSAVRKAIGGIASALRESYVFPDAGSRAADALENALKDNAYAGVTDPAAFARRLTEQLRRSPQTAICG